ncbi:MAG TPA: PAS domain S-box protein [Syntrophorhabdaceae bacterium]|jgi:PAS domain S-box-containing protein
MKGNRKDHDLKAEIEDLKVRLAEAEETIRAIRHREVDALVLEGPEGLQTYTIEGADRPYRVFVESMNEGAVTLSPDGTILHCNTRFAEMIKRPLNKIIGASFLDFLTPSDRGWLEHLAQECGLEGCKGETLLTVSKKQKMPVYFSVTPLTPEINTFCMVVTDLTSLKQAQDLLKKANEELESRVKERTAELQEGEERWAATLASIGDGVIATDGKGKITFLNRVAEASTGWTLKEAAATPVRGVFRVISEEGRHKVPDPFASLLKGEEMAARANHSILIKKDGSEAIIDHSGAPIRDKEGNTTGVVLVFRDITERRLAEEVRKKSESMFRLLFETSPDAVFLTSPDGGVIAANPAACAMFGMTEAELRRAGRKSLVDPDDPRFADRLKERQRTGRVIRAELNFIKKGGQKIIAEVDSVILPGSPPRSFVIMRDITERKRIEQALRESEEKFARSFSNNPVAIAMNRLEDGLILEANDTWLALHGMRREEAIGRSARQMGLWPDRADMERFIRVMHEKGAIHGWEQEFINKAGGTFIAQVSAQVMTLRGEKVILLAMTDITERKRAEEVVRKSRDELEFRVQERTAELEAAYETLRVETDERKRMEVQLRQSQKMEALGTLAGGIAHDFNNILAAVLGFAEMSLEDAPQGSTLEKNLQYILKSSFRARDLIRQMLTFSRKTEYTVKPLPLTPLVKETAKLLRASIPTTIEIHVDTAAASDMILADPTGMQQIIMNLCTNAAYAMRERGGRLTIALSDVDLKEDRDDMALVAGPYIQLAIKDTGDGMTAGVMKRIFEPFFTTKGSGQGTGMGLAVVYGIVKSFKGDITVESKPGEGSTFRVLIPKIYADEVSEPAAAEAIAGGKEHILFIDDEEIIMELGKTMLERLGYIVTATTDSIEALQVFSQDPLRFDLIITDQTMPGITGLRLARELRKVRSDLPIILCTGNNESINSDTLKKAGISRFLMKPLSRREMAAAVRTVLDADGEEGTG